jgi:hypothetical protein
LAATIATYYNAFTQAAAIRQLKQQVKNIGPG